jgi:hypothetical protein
MLCYNPVCKNLDGGASNETLEYHGTEHQGQFSLGWNVRYAFFYSVRGMFDYNSALYLKTAKTAFVYKLLYNCMIN